MLGVLLCSPSVANSEWGYLESPDLMRGTITKIATLRSSDSSPAALRDLSATLTVIAREDGETGITIGIEGDVVQCGHESCDALIKFDRGSIKKVSAPFRSGERFFTPWDQGPIANAVQHADELVVEINLARHGRQQFVFQLAGIPIEAVSKPLEHVLKYQYGTSRQEFEDLGDEVVEDGDTICHKSINNLGSIVLSGAVGSGMVCFVKEKLYLVVLEVQKSDKKSIKNIQNRLDAIYGERESYSDEYEKWPKAPEGVNKFTSHAVKLGETFIFTDDSLDLLTMESKSD